MKQKKNVYSIRKFSLGASSVAIASLFFLGAGNAQAAEDETSQPPDSITQTEDSSTSTDITSPEATQDNMSENSLSDDTTQETTQDNSTEQAQPSDVSNETTLNEENTTEPSTPSTTLTNENTPPEELEAPEEKPATKETQTITKDDETTETVEETTETAEETTPTNDKATEETTNQNDTTNITTDADTSLNTADNTSTQDTTPETTQETDQPSTTSEDNTTTDQPQSEETAQTDQATTNAPDQTDEQDVTTETNTQSSSTDSTTPETDQTVSEETTQKEGTTTKEEDPNSDLTDQQDAQSVETATAPKDDSDAPEAETQHLEATDKETSEDITVPEALKDNDTAQPEKDDDSTPDKALDTLAKSNVATTNTQQQTRDQEQVKTQPNQKAKQGFYKNDDPIILVHGFVGFMDDNKVAVYPHYWGGERLNVRDELEKNGYETYEASVSAFGSNYDRAVELYYYIKGGTVDYGAAHAEKYGHERYGKTYEGIYKDWEPGKKVHLVGHSMGGQTIRQLEEFLRNGNQEEIAYQQEHGGEISPLFAGGHDEMISSITTLATPHNGSHASDKLGNEPVFRQFIYDFAKFMSNADSKMNFGLDQWGIKRTEGEKLLDYWKRIKEENPLWTTEDNGFYDLTLEGAEKLNEQTSLNPNIVYTSYAGEATHPSLLGKQKSDLSMMFLLSLTGNVIGKVDDPAWRENDGLVSIVSAEHPTNEAWTKATDEIQKGIWQVKDVLHGWDHLDFVGLDLTDVQRTAEELRQFYLGIAEDLVAAEKVTS